MPLIPALGRQRQPDLCEFEDSLQSTKAKSRTGTKATQGNLVSKKQIIIIIIIIIIQS